LASFFARSPPHLDSSGVSRPTRRFGSPGWLNDVEVQGTTAIIDVDLKRGYGSTAAQSEFVWTSLRTLAFQFPEIDLLEPRHNGDCEAFGNIVQAGVCLLARRDGSYMAADDLPD
jgi:hypothetical protein